MEQGSTGRWYGLARLGSSGEIWGVELGSDAAYLAACPVPPECTTEQVPDILAGYSPQQRREFADWVRTQERIWQSWRYDWPHSWHGTSG